MGQWLLGIEADFEYFRSAGSSSVTGIVLAPAITGTVFSSVSTDWLLTVRPRLGVILNNWLLYATGGLAVTNLKASWGFSGGGVAESASESSTKAGWTVGGGFETASPGKFTIGVEYLYVKFDNVDSPTSFAVSLPVTPLANPFNHSADLAANIVRARLNKLF